MSNQVAVRFVSAAQLALLMALAACGGGGGGGSSAPATYSVGGSVTGLATGESVVLQSAGAGSATVSASGTFTLPTPLASGSSYAVTVTTQPATQTCTVASGSGTVPSSAVTTVAVTCVTNAYAVSGTVSGLGSHVQVVLQDNGGDDLTVTASGSFSFPTKVADGAAYAVTIRTQPVGQSCAVQNASGTVGAAAITNVQVVCGAAVHLVAGDVRGVGSLDGTGAAASFSDPEGLAADASGNLYVADTSNSTIRKVSPAGVVTTFAGATGVMGHADGTGALASFIHPTGVAVDSSGTVYVADSGNDTIRKITPAGVVTTLAGTALAAGHADGSGAAARFSAPQGIAVDSSGNLYVTDQGNSTIRRITPAGVVTTLAGTAGVAGHADGTGAAASFNHPDGVCVDSAGNLYVADGPNNTIRKIAPGGVVTTLAGTAGTSGHADGTGAGASFNVPYGVSVDASGNVYVADKFNATIRKVSPAGVVTTLAGAAGVFGSADGTAASARFAGPASITVDGAGDVYVGEAGTNANTIRKITPAAVVTTLAGAAAVFGHADGTGAAASFGETTGVAIDPAGNAYVVDYDNGTVRKVTRSGVVTTFVSAAIGLNSPVGIAIDTAGNLYVADPGNAVVRKISPAGVVTTLAGTIGVAGHADGTGAAASFNGPAGIAVDSSGNVYVADGQNFTIRKITAAGVVTTLAGTPGVNGHADGTGAAASFGYTNGIAVDASGTVYVADSSNNTIRKITAAGVVTTLAGTPGVTGHADGTGAAASFSVPASVAVDGSGNVYVADANDFLIRKISPAGVVKTVVGSVLQNGYVADGPVTGPIPSPNYMTLSADGILYFTAAFGLLSVNPAP